MSAAITQRLPQAVVLRNQIPKAYLPYDLYCNLIPNEDENVYVYDQVPRTGSFEVSYKGLVSTRGRHEKLTWVDRYLLRVCVRACGGKKATYLFKIKQANPSINLIDYNLY